MDKKFTFDLPGFWYGAGTFIDREFNNHYGNWHVHVGNLGNCFKFMLYYNPSIKLLEDALKNLKINVKIKSNRSNRSSTETAVQCANSPLYEFVARSVGLTNGFCHYSITVEVDATSLDESLKRNDLPNLANFIEKAFDEGTLADITIKTHDNQEIKAHKLILSRSPVFDAMLNKHDTKEDQQNIIEVTDIDHEVMTEMIRYMYTDEIPKMKEIALDLLIAANNYMLPGLAYATEKYLRKNINIQNFEEIAVIAEHFNLPKLGACVVKFIIDNRNTILRTAEWKSFKEENPQCLVNLVVESIIEFMKYVTT